MAPESPPGGLNLIAQGPVGAAGPDTQAPSSDQLSPNDLEDLLGPIALYPDPLLANVLAASVYPDEVAGAAHFIASGGSADQIADQP